MYDFLKLLQPVAEAIGNVKTALLYSDDKVWGDVIRVKGKTADGRAFELELTVKDADDDA